MADPALDDELAAELGSIASFIERVAKTPAFEPGEMLEIAADDPDLELTEAIGAGGAGVVYRARDRKLDREVAVKVQRVSGNDEADERLLAEARALARLSHPNVVSVFEVRQVGGHLVVLMELVGGPNLRAWLAEADRGRDEILAMFTEAGAGLAAAHRAGVVHRDFKPANVIAGTDGRVRVVDFGLAGDPGEVELGGTPAYMAPEQSAGESVDARADQYAFCKSLLEALGQERADSISPGWLRQVLERGLAEAPAERFADMDALLAALRPPRRWPIIAAIGAAAAVALIALSPRACGGEALGLMVDNVVSEHRAANDGYQEARRQLATGHRLRALDGLTTAYARGVDHLMLRRELGSAMPSVESFVREIPIDGLGVIDELRARGDGSRLAVTSGGVTRLIDVDRGAELARTDGDQPRFLDGGALLAVVGPNGRWSIFDSESGSPVREIEIGMGGEVATGGDVIFAIRGAARAVSARTGELLFSAPGVGALIGGLSVSANGQRMLVARGQTTLFDRTGKVLLRSESRELLATAWLAPDGSRFATAGRTSLAIYADDGALETTLRPVPAARQISFSPDGAELSAISAGQTCVWRIAAGKKRGCWAAVGPVPPTLTPDLARAVAGRLDGTAELIETDGGRRRAVLAAATDGQVAVAISDDGGRVFTAGVDSRVLLWRGDIDNLHAAIEHRGKRDVQIGGGRLAIGRGQRLEVWDLDDATEPLFAVDAETPGPVQVAVSGDGEVIAWGGKTWRTSTGSAIAEIENWPGRPLARLDQRGERLVICADGSCRSVDARTGAELWRHELGEAVGADKFPPLARTAIPTIGPDGRVLLTGFGADVVLDPDSGAIVRQLRRKATRSAISATFVGERIAVGDGQLTYVAELGSDRVETFAGPGHGLVAHPDGRRLVVPSKSGANVVDLETGARLRIAIDSEPTNGAAISPDGALFAVGRGMGLIEIFDVATGGKITERSAGGYVNTLHFSRAGHLVALASERTLVWPLPVERRSPAEVRAAVDRVLR